MPAKLDAIQVCDLFRAIVQAIAGKADQVSVSQHAEGEVTVVTILAPPEECGRIIGRQGKTARSLRVLLHAIGIAQGNRYLLNILERS